MRLTQLGGNALLAVLRDCVRFDDVLREVNANLSSNRWWPLEVEDWRLRMLIAGWSTRVSYNHIEHYQRVVRAVKSLGWNRVVQLTDRELSGIVAPLGLSATRIAYCRSLREFIVAHGDQGTLLEEDNDRLVEQFADEVDGAGYKVAQCAILYAKGYDCGIIPVDSGMVEMLDPLVPHRVPRSAVGHEDVRRWLEHLTNSYSDDVKRIAATAGFGLDHLNGKPATWWVHLVLIYYKRLHWNRRHRLGPFRRHGGKLMDSEETPPWHGMVDTKRFPGVIFEGVDGAGKTEAAEALRAEGYRYWHATYAKGDDLFEKYRNRLGAIQKPTVWDRCFVSEYVYGRVSRDGTRLSLEECVALLKLAAASGFVVFHLEETLPVIKARRSGNEDDASRLIREYRRFFDVVRHVIPVYTVQPSQLAPGYLLRYLEN